LIFSVQYAVALPSLPFIYTAKKKGSKKSDSQCVFVRSLMLSLHSDASAPPGQMVCANALASATILITLLPVSALGKERHAVSHSEFEKVLRPSCNYTGELRDSVLAIVFSFFAFLNDFFFFNAYMYPLILSFETINDDTRLLSKRVIKSFLSNWLLSVLWFYLHCLLILKMASFLYQCIFN
jgi:hypothetical protein